jgi:signal transduction histidine kinase
VRPPNTAEIRQLIHDLREPLGALAINLELLESEPQTTAAQSGIKAMQVNMERAIAALEEIAFVLENGHPSTTGQ